MKNTGAEYNFIYLKQLSRYNIFITDVRVSKGIYNGFSFLFYFLFHLRYIQCHFVNTYILDYAGGSYYNNLGAAVDYLFQAPDPNYRKTTYSGRHGEVYGGEYDSPFIPNEDDNDVSYAVSRRKGVCTVLMIPVKDTCYRGWNRT